MSFSSGDVAPDWEERANLIADLKRSCLILGVILALNTLVAAGMTLLFLCYYWFIAEPGSPSPNFAVAVGVTGTISLLIVTIGVLRGRSWALYFGLYINYAVTALSLGSCNLPSVLLGVVAAYFLHRTIYLAKRVAELPEALPAEVI